MVWRIRNPILLDPETSKPRYLPHRAAPGSSQFDGARQELRRDLDENYRGTPWYPLWLWKLPIFWGILPFRHGGLILGCLSLFGMICLASCFSWDVFFCGASLNIRMVLTWPMLLAGLGYHQSSGAWLCGLRQHLVVQPCYLDKIGASPDGTTSETSLDWLVRRGLKHPETGEEIALKGCIDAGSVAPKDRSWNLWLTGSKPPFPPATTLWWSLPRGCFSVNRSV
jgi:hypothetical protein